MRQEKFSQAADTRFLATYLWLVVAMAGIGYLIPLIPPLIMQSLLRLLAPLLTLFVIGVSVYGVVHRKRYPSTVALSWWVVIIEKMAAILIVLAIGVGFT